MAVKFSTVLRLAFLPGLILLLVTTCTFRNSANQEGKRLAEVYCGTCHQVPSPLELDKKTWLLGVLPKMGPRLGIYSFQNFSYEVNKNNQLVPAGFYPDSAVLTADEWGKIVKYFYDEAPDSLLHAYPPISKNLDQFIVHIPENHSGMPPVSSLVKIDGQQHHVIIAHGTQMKLKSFDTALQMKDETQTVTVAVNVAAEHLGQQNNYSAMLLNMGALSPFDVTHGSLQQVNLLSDGSIRLSPTLLIDSLARPVHLSIADLDGDDKEDLIVCCFGNFTGELCWLRNLGNNQYEKRILRPLPGAIQTRVLDVNRDGRPDILALMAQGDEGLFLYTQNPDRTFSEKRLLRFSPVAGSVSFDLTDFNNDGYPDLIYTSGDNADYSLILKPYHGVYIFTNDGHWNFTKKYFFPINGCFKAIASDFDLDGDPDIATISYFSDFKKRPEESFVYLRNDGQFTFSPFTIREFGLGRWLTMDSGDLDGDGDIDLVLGNMSIGPSNFPPNKEWRNGPEFLLLENKARSLK